MADLGPLLAPRSVVLIVERAGGDAPDAEVEQALHGAGYQGLFQRVEVAATGEPDPAGRIGAADLALISVSVERIATIVEACARSGCQAAIVLNGPEGDVDAAAVQSARIADLAGAGLVVLGPNSQGVLSLPTRLFAGTGSLLRHHDLRCGGVAVVTQSGFGHTLVSLGETEGLGFNYVVSTGNEAGLDVVDVTRWLLDRDEVDVIWLILESVRRGRDLAEVGRHAYQAGKPIVAWKTGTTEAGRVAAASHTGAVASDDRLFCAAADAGRLVLVEGEDELIGATRALITSSRITGRGVGIVTVSGGAGVALADCCADVGLSIPPLADATVERIRRLLPPTRPVENPLDVTRAVARNPAAYRAVVELVGNDENVGQVIVWHGGIDGDRATALAGAISDVRSSVAKPLLVVWAPRPGSADDAYALLAEAGVPSYPSVRRAAAAASALWAPQPSAQPSEMARYPTRIRPPDMNGPIGEMEAKKYLEAYGVPLVSEVYLPIEQGEVAAPATWDLRFPVVAKADTTQVRSRKAAGLVRLGLSSPEDVLAAAAEILLAARDADIAADGVIVQEMLDGLEVFIGGLADPQFGPAVTVGLGGQFVESLGRPTVRLAPLTFQGARRAVLESEIAPVLSEPHVDAVADCLSRVSWLLVDHAAWIDQIDVNPIFVTQSGAFAADALVISSGPESTSDRRVWSALQPFD